MIRQIRGKRILLQWMARLLFLACLTSRRPVVSFHFCGPSPQGRTMAYQGRVTFPPSPFHIHASSFWVPRYARGDGDEEKKYYSSSNSRSTRRSRNPARSKAPDDGYYENYYEEEYEEEEEYELPFPEPLRPDGKIEKLARYQSPDYLDDEDDDFEADYYFEDEEYEDDEDDSSGGNFWSNPAGGVDRSVKPLSPARRPRNEEYEPRPTPTRQRKRTPIRSSSMSAAPQAAKDLYDRLFWYGFDPGDSEGVGDKTAFGGTKGKFNGLTFLQASDAPGRPIQARRKQQRRQLPPSRKNEDDYAEDDYEDDFYEEPYDEEGEDSMSRRRSGNNREYTPPADTPAFKKNEPDGHRHATSPRPNADSSPQGASTSSQGSGKTRRRSKPRRREYDYDDVDMYDDDSDFGVNWLSREVSSWFSGSDEDDDDTPRARRKARSPQNEWSPFNVFDAFFGVNREDMAYKAEMYNSKMGIGPKPRSRQRSSLSPREKRREARDNPRRPGYAYRYNADDETDDNEASFVVDVEPLAAEQASTGNTEPVEAGSENKKEQTNGASYRKLSWQERALAVERVPPADIPGWGPSGELPMDGRTKAIMDALEDIQTARQKLEGREKKEALAKEDITILKVDAEMQRRRLEESRSNARSAQERLRQIELDIDDASRVLRRARTQVQIARQQMEELQARHWALLGFYNPEQAEERVAEALNEYRLSETVTQTVGGSNGSTQTQPAAVQERKNEAASPRVGDATSTPDATSSSPTVSTDQSASSDKSS